MQEIDDYASLNNAKTNVYTTVINDPSGLPVVVSVLELCAATYNDSLVMDYRCTATNSLSGTPTFLGLSNTAVFDIVPISELVHVNVCLILPPVFCPSIFVYILCCQFISILDYSIIG